MGKTTRGGLKRRPIEYALVNAGCYKCISHKANTVGYTRIHLNGRIQLLHRYLYQQVHGELNSNQWVLHRCNNRFCVNVEHLYVGDPFDNMLDRSKDCRGNTRLTKEDVVIIRKLQPIWVGTQRELGKMFNVSESTISEVLNPNNRRWSWVENGNQLVRG